jgi:Mrp family chromosome partitioning ATPase
MIRSAEETMLTAADQTSPPRSTLAPLLPGAAPLLSLAQQLGMGPAARVERRRIGITSALRGEGVTTVTSGLAPTIARWSPREVLLIDANVSDPALSRQHGDPSPGLSEVCAGEYDVEAALRVTDDANLLLLPSGRECVCFLGADALLRQLSERFDYQLVDLPPLPQWHAALPLVAALDGVVLVVESERAARSALRETRTALERLGVPLLGAVLNKQHSYLPRWLRAWL